MKTKKHTNKSKFPALSSLTLAISCALTAAPALASDLEIYNPNTSSTTTTGTGWTLPSDYKPVVMLTLNIGDGMGIEGGSFNDDYKVSDVASCRPVGNRPARERKQEQRKIAFYAEDGKTSIGSITYLYETCKTYPTRLSVLREAFLKFLANPNPEIAKYKQIHNIDASLNKISDFKMGLVTNFAASGPNGGYIVLPAMEMTDANRLLMAQKIAAQDAEGKGATPLSLTIAETMSYLSGSTTAVGATQDIGIVVGVMNSRTKQWQNCRSLVANRKTSAGWNLQNCSPFRPVGDGPTQTQALANYDPLIYNITTFAQGPMTYYIAQYKNGIHTHSGFNISHPNSKLSNRYKTPLNNKNQCAANGIYMLSDGDTLDADQGILVNTLNAALGNQRKEARIATNGSFPNKCPGTTLRDQSVKKTTMGVTSTVPILWSCAGNMAQYARTRYTADGKIDTKTAFVVKDEKNNNFYADIRFASVGYGGGIKKGVENATKVSKKITLLGGTKTNVQVYNCSRLTDERAKNMCYLGERGAGYGEGGFYYVPPPKNAQDTTPNSILAESLFNFMFSLAAPPKSDTTAGGDRDPVTTGVMAVPLDILNPERSRGSAYLPILDPKPGETSLWYGNLKKYAINNSVMVDAQGRPVLKAGGAGQFNRNTYDFWNIDRQADDAKPQLGGTFSRLFDNDSKNRTLFVDHNGGLHNITADNVNTVRTDPTDAQLVANRIRPFLDGNNPNNKVLGAVLHSIPQLITYGATITNGKITSRDDAVLYGSMDGALHLVDNNTGREYFSFVPNQLLTLQPDALTKGKTKSGNIPYGVDGPWNSYSTSFEISGNTYKINQNFASGGLRMGGSTYYGLNISNKTTPTLLYSVGSTYGEKLENLTTSITGVSSYSRATNDEKAALARMGQSWAKPSTGYVRSNGKKVLVDFLAGGYDMGYESASFSPTSTNPAQGNALYMVRLGEEEVNRDNRTQINTSGSGKLLWWLGQGASSSGVPTGNSTASQNLQSSKHPDLYHSIVSQVRVLDRDYDGYVDHIYFADLGGRVWRADLNNTATTENFNIVRVVKLLDVSDQKSGNDAAPRFYERPLITFTNEIDGTIMAMVSVGTGNRSLPISDKRTKPDALYNFVDKDVAASRSALFDNSYTLRTQNLSVGSLAELKFNNDDVTIKTDMKANRKQGWYYPISKWGKGDGTATTATGLKSLQEPNALKGYLITSIFNPSVQSTTETAGETTQNDVCVPPRQTTNTLLAGVTQSVLTCLPFGNCATTNGGRFNDYPTGDVSENIGGDHISSKGGDDTIFKIIDLEVKDECTGTDCKLKPGDIKVDFKRILNPRDWWEK